LLTLDRLPVMRSGQLQFTICRFKDGYKASEDQRVRAFRVDPAIDLSRWMVSPDFTVIDFAENGWTT